MLWATPAAGSCLALDLPGARALTRPRLASVPHVSLTLAGVAVFPDPASLPSPSTRLASVTPQPHKPQ